MNEWSKGQYIMVEGSAQTAFIAVWKVKREEKLGGRSPSSFQGQFQMAQGTPIKTPQLLKVHRLTTLETTR